MSRRTYNPGGVDETLPTIKVRDLTPTQVDECAHRLDVTAETPDLADWGYLVGRTLHIVDDAAAIHAAIGGDYSDLRTCLDIAADQAAWAWGIEGQGFLRSMQSLVRKAERAVAEQRSRAEDTR